MLHPIPGPFCFLPIPMHPKLAAFYYDLYLFTLEYTEPSLRPSQEKVRILCLVRLSTKSRNTILPVQSVVTPHVYQRTEYPPSCQSSAPVYTIMEFS